MRNKKVICLCPLEGPIDIIGKKWGLLTVNELGNHGALRYNSLLSELKGISPSTLALMLNKLEKEGLVRRKVFRNTPPKVEYSLTSDGGHLRNAIIPLLKWSSKKGKYKVRCSCSLMEKKSKSG